MNINPITGLKESVHEKYDIPIVHQRSIRNVKFSGQRTAVHRVPLGQIGTLDFYAQLGRNDELLVGFHGATPKARNFYPRFERVRSFRKLTNSFMNFSDPTLQLEADSSMLLSWYLGSAGWDPIYDIARVVKRVKGKTGAKHFAFIGGSGGGFAALRISALFPGSLAFVQEPQTDIGLYWESVVNKYFATAWPEWDKEALLNAFPERFNMNYLYSHLSPNNVIYYTQSRADTEHMEKHCHPFMKAVGLSPSHTNSQDQTRNFRIYDGEIKGHGRITANEFDGFFNDAMAVWRQVR
ncbi:hypothetical protein ACNPON_08565 [Glutamicibacter sp. AGC13]